MTIRFDKQLGIDIQNTRSASQAPESPEDYGQLDDSTSGEIELLPVFSGRAFTQLVQYPVIVEQWRKKDSGRHRRAWERDFTPAERNKLASFHGRFHRWHLVTGAPLRISCRLKTLELVQRAVAWFAALD